MVNLGGGEQIHVPGEYVLRWRYLHVDPHFAHANLYADAGLAYRRMNTSIHTGRGRRARRAEPGIPAAAGSAAVGPQSAGQAGAVQDLPGLPVLERGLLPARAVQLSQRDHSRDLTGV